MTAVVDTIRALDRLVSRTATFEVIPICDDELQLDLALFQAYVERREGLFIYVDHTTASATGNLCSTRGPLLQAYARNSGLICTLADDGTHVSATLDGRVSPSDRVCLAVLERLASSQLDAYEIIFLGYPTAKLDEARQALLWNLCTEVMPAAPPPRARVFIPAAGVSVVPDNHCCGSNPVRLAISTGRSIQRQAPAHQKVTLDVILRRLDEPLVLFLGAGASASAKLPLGNRVRDEALRTLRSGYPGDPIDGLRELLDQHDRWRTGEQSMQREVFASHLTLERVLREEFFTRLGEDRAESPTVKYLDAACRSALQRSPPGRAALHELCSLLPRLVVATVNFDRQIEEGISVDHEVIATPRAFEAHGELIGRRLSGESADRIPILKLHGTIDQPDTMIASVDDTTAGFTEPVSRALDTLFQGTLPRHWVWIGCSMRDVDMTAYIRQRTFAQITEWWVDPLPADSLTAWVQEHRWPTWPAGVKLEQRLITERADDFLVALLARARSLAAV